METRKNRQKIFVVCLVVAAIFFALITGFARTVFASASPSLSDGEVWVEGNNSLTATIKTTETFTAFLNYCVQDAEEGCVFDITIGANIQLLEGDTIQMKEGNAFIGTFDGGGYTIVLNGAALFSEVGDGTTTTVIENVVLGGEVTVTAGDTSVGALACELNGVTVTGCTNNASVNCSQNITNVGGLVGIATNSTLTNCINNGIIEASGGTNIGGLIGTSEDTVLTSCTNNGKVSASGRTYAGGLVANATGTLSITDCSNTGNVTGVTAGGLVGNASDASAVTLTNCSNTATISGQTVSEQVASGSASITNYNHLAGTAYTFPSDATGVTNSSGVTDGCTYTSGVTYYVAANSNYTIS